MDGPSSFLASPVAGWLGSVEIQNLRLRDRMLYLDIFILRDISNAKNICQLFRLGLYFWKGFEDSMNSPLCPFFETLFHN